MPNTWPAFGTSVRNVVPQELLSEAALLSYLCLSSAELRKIWYYSARMYQSLNVAKKNGRSRLINAPDRRLKFLQRRIALKLCALYPMRNPVHGYVVGRSVKTNASSHLKQKFVLNLDIKDFFSSITDLRVQNMLMAIGINPRVAVIVSRICCHNGRLPQGGPASPVLSNMICFRLDRTLLKVAKEARCIYTRYADDITMSGLRPLAPLFEGPLALSGPVAPELLSTALKSAFSSNGFALNPDKIFYADKNSRRIVTGLKVNEGLNVDRCFVRNVRAALFSVEKDLTAAQKRYVDDFGGNTSIAAHLKGKIAWLGNVKGLTDPVYRALALRFNKSFASQPIKMQPTREEKIDRSVWVIEHLRSMDPKYRQGSAFFLQDVGLVTAAHCVEDIKEATVHHPSRPANKFKVVVDHYSKHRDLALLSHSIPENDFYWLVKGVTPAATGDFVTAIGYPIFGPADKVNFRSGMVSSTTTRSLIKLFEVNFKLSQGMSGGPVIDKQDAAVGIVHKGGPGEGRDFAIVIAELDKWKAAGFPDD